jgi:hypothetical protein
MCLVFMWWFHTYCSTIAACAFKILCDDRKTTDENDVKQWLSHFKFSHDSKEAVFVMANCDDTDELHALGEGDIVIEMLGPRRVLWAAISRSVNGQKCPSFFFFFPHVLCALSAF